MSLSAANRAPTEAGELHGHSRRRFSALVPGSRNDARELCSGGHAHRTGFRRGVRTCIGGRIVLSLLILSSLSLCASAGEEPDAATVKTPEGGNRTDSASQSHSRKRLAVEPAGVPFGRKLDIVIAHYHANTLEPMLTNWKRFLETEKVKALEPTVFVYSLNSEIDLAAYKPIIGETGHATRLPNVGREGRVYLAHILAYWGNFADHTLFSQAMADQLLEKRFQALFSPDKTGVLALAYFGHHDCAVGGWLPHGQLVQIYSVFTRRFCPPEGFSSMFMGQFVVSRKRIQTQPWDVYEHVEGLLAAPVSHWIHTTHKHKHLKNDSMPFFGHSMERAWSLAFDCHELWRHDFCKKCDDQKWEDCHEGACQCLD